SAATSTRLISTTLSTQSAGRLTFHLIGRAFRLLILVLLATFAFAQLPINPIRRTQWWDRSLEMDGTLWPGPTVFMLAAFGLVILSIGQWRAQTRAQAGLFVKSSYVLYHYRELKSILVRQQKQSREGQ
ncbi:MAG: hypothetical protein IT423_22005, partial [Pirellulaceae bacterium]|nr:hypothetical protein [Pirellulaceae bacterium]